VALPSSVGSIVTDSSVPEGHKGLHGFLYGEAGAEVHEETDRDYQARDVRHRTLEVLVFCLCTCSSDFANGLVHTAGLSQLWFVLVSEKLLFRSLGRR
jgi:hypothetical protein